MSTTIDAAPSNEAMLTDAEVDEFDAVFSGGGGGDVEGLAEPSLRDLESEVEDDEESSVEAKNNDWTMDAEDTEDVVMGGNGGDVAAAEESVALGNDSVLEVTREYEEANAEGEGEGLSEEAFLPNASPLPVKEDGIESETVVVAAPSRMPPPARPAPFRNQKQDDFVKKGARTRALLTTTLKAMTNSFASSTALADAACSGKAGDAATDAAVKDAGQSAKKTWNARTDFAHIQELAQERAEEVMALQRKLQEAQTQIDMLKGERAASEEDHQKLQAKIDRTLEALQIAGGNAANARAEADASNARAESLSGQLNDLQSFIGETKRGMEVVRREHDEVSRAARSVESRLITVEGELTRAARAKKDAVDERDVLKARADKAEELARTLQDRVDDYHGEVRMLKKDLLEMEEFEKVRSDRTNRIDAEFQEARAGLLEATSAAAEAESTVTSLRSVVEELRKENEQLHERVEKGRDDVAKERAKHDEELTAAEREAQKLRLRCEEQDEEVKTLQREKASAEKQAEQMRKRISLGSSKTMEKTQDASSTITPKTSDLGFLNTLGAKDAPLVSDESKRRKIVTELPQRESTDASRKLTYSFQKENNPNANKHPRSDCDAQKRKVVRSNRTCTLCGKEGGMLLSCQCEGYCGHKAHALCIGKFRLGTDKSERTIFCSEESS
ncbi:hypothetical protein ACHAXT_004589 [Thalassiosira profunda]